MVLLGMANRCQMGINGPPNVLLQKAFFSAQYFAYIAEQHIHHQLAKESLNDIQNFFEKEKIFFLQHFFVFFTSMSFQRRIAGMYDIADS